MVDARHAFDFGTAAYSGGRAEQSVACGIDLSVVLRLHIV
jgi:hypothetical protein